MAPSPLCDAHAVSFTAPHLGDLVTALRTVCRSTAAGPAWLKEDGGTGRDPGSTPGHSPGLLAHAADPDLLELLVGAAALADVERTVPTAALGVDKEGEGRAAAHAAVFRELLVLREDAALAALLVQLLLHLAGAGEHKERADQVRGLCPQSMPTPALPQTKPQVGPSSKTIKLTGIDCLT